MSEQSGPEEQDRLLAALGAALDPVDPPAGLVARAAGLVELLDLDHDLAALQDTAPELVGSRGTTTAERLSFASADGAVLVEVVPGVDGLAGQVLAGTVVEVVLEPLRGAPVTTAVDGLGRFALAPPTGPARLRLRRPTSRDDVVTDWFLS